MFKGHLCRDLSATVDQHIGRRMGAMTVAEFAAHLEFDARNPEQLDALAFQLLCAGRACKARGVPEFAGAWKEQSMRIGRLAAEARQRLETMPNPKSHPGFFDRRSAGRPGCLDADLRLPFAMRLHLGRPTLPNGMYQPELVDGMVYRKHGGRDLKTWIEPVDGGRAFPVENSTLRGLMAMGRLEALPLSAFALPRAA